MSHINSEQLQSLKLRLQQMKQDYEQRLHQSDHYGLADSLREQTGELSGIDNHPADLATELYEREKDIALNEHHEIELERIDTSLQHIDQGTYGKCVVCGQSIPYDRLDAVPSTMYCIDHCPETFTSDRRPVEEQFLTPPFGRTSLDERDDQNGFDGEDAWQIVEAWGTSDTPAMHEQTDVDSYDQLYIEASEELDGCVEAFESFVATDMTGRHVTVVRNRQYERYIAAGEGVPLLEEERSITDLDEDWR
ncbi:TraR/DksA C4-type zinc finger protein [Paenibacillus sp. UMB4589-SE434]|uniref:TraR/DksA C4-type zinc finger protein n=1 Tax=Paenibacillus sp. UMB4589-SE434 TaxID=3046314 RepID=UPI00254AFBBD|nr:TraR/DksA C4-type zinc finger protein [Paenibacillus sp. UMB4589-SE434]MDK8180922.1 TraR/DksA C4-type zinc finger protein [Paenibacillus sp. UMB4589-SE434]